MKNYYNDNSPFCCDWLRNLIAAGLIPPGDVDPRSIKEVTADDLRGYDQCHFFAGVAGWAEALRLAGWPNERPVWTASCPCQPLSGAGKRGGEKDERHLWPELYRLISECRPECVFGEQVASSDGLEWLDGISLDLEELHYAVGSSDRPAASEGAPQIRQRVWWLAEPICERVRVPGYGTTGAAAGGVQGANGQRQRIRADAGAGGEDLAIGLGNSSSEGLPLSQCQELPGSGRGQEGRAAEQSSGAWSDFAIAPCRDGSYRRFEPGSFPLAHGIPRRLGQSKSALASLARLASSNRKGRLSGYGNSINPYVAAQFIRAYLAP